MTEVTSEGRAPVYVADYDDGPSVGIIDLVTWLGERKGFIAAVTGAAAVASVALALSLPNQYTARATLLPPGSQQQSGSAAALAALGSLGGLAGGLSAKTPDELYVSLLKSDTVRRALGDEFDLKTRYEAETQASLSAEMAARIRVSADKKSGLIAVDVDDRDPEFAAKLANAHADKVAELLSRLAVSEAQQRRVFFEKQLNDTKDALVNAEQALRQVQEQSGMVALDQQAEAIIKSVADLRARIVEREVRLRVLRTRATAQNPDVQLLASELSALRAELNRMESASEKAGGGIDIPAGKLPAAGLDYVRAMREVKFQEAMMTSMLRQLEVAKLDEAKESPGLQVVDVAQPPDRKSKPKRASIVLGLTFAALLLSSVWVLAGAYLRAARQQDPEQQAAWQSLKNAWRWRKGG